MTCADAQPLISRLVDGELPDGDAAAVFSHLAGCPECREFLRDTVRIQAAVRQWAERPIAIPEKRPSIPARLQPPRWVSYVAVAAAAIVFMIIGALGTLAVARFDRTTDQADATRVVWVLPEREITPSSIQTHWR